MKKEDTKNSNHVLAVKNTTKFKAANDPNKPKRPVSPFFEFMKEFRIRFQVENPHNKSVAAIGKAGGIKWKKMSNAEKAPYVTKFDNMNIDYNMNMTAYNKKQVACGNGVSNKSMPEHEIEEDSDDDVARVESSASETYKHLPENGPLDEEFESRSKKRSKTSESGSYSSSNDDFERFLEPRDNIHGDESTRPIGRDRTNFNRASSSESGVILTEFIELVNQKMEAITEISLAKLELEKEKLELEKESLRSSELQVFFMNTNHLTGRDREFAEREKDRIRNKYFG